MRCARLFCAGDPYLLVQCALVLLAQQVNLSPHSRSAIRHGGEARIPLSSTIKRLLSQVRLERKSCSIPSTPAGEKGSRRQM